MTPWWREPTRGQWMAFGAAWLGWMLDAFDFTIYLLVIPMIAEEFDVSLTATAGSIRSSRPAPSGTDAEAEARSKKTLPSTSVAV